MDFTVLLTPMTALDYGNQLSERYRRHEEARRTKRRRAEFPRGVVLLPV